MHPDIGDDRTVTLDLPAAEAELLDAQEQLGVEGWEGVMVIDYDGIIPYAADFTDLPMELEELNAFTKTERDIPRSEVPKLKALLEQFEVQDGGFCIAMDPNTGEILAWANSPTYDLNNPRVVSDPVLNQYLADIESGAYTKEEAYQKALAEGGFQRGGPRQGHFCGRDRSALHPVD